MPLELCYSVMNKKNRYKSVLCITIWNQHIMRWDFFFHNGAAAVKEVARKVALKGV